MFDLLVACVVGVENLAHLARDLAGLLGVEDGAAGDDVLCLALDGSLEGGELDAAGNGLGGGD